MLTLEIQVPSVHSARHGGQFLSVLYPKMSVGSFSVPLHLHSQHQCLQAASSFWGPPVFSKSWRFQALLPDCSQSPWPQATLPEVILCSWQPAETSLSETSCISSEECALHCLTRAGASLGPPPPHLSLTARAWQPFYLPVSSRHTSPGLRLQDEAQTLEVS